MALFRVKRGGHGAPMDQKQKKRKGNSGKQDGKAKGSGRLAAGKRQKKNYSEATIFSLHPQCRQNNQCPASVCVCVGQLGCGRKTKALTVPHPQHP